MNHISLSCALQKGLRLIVLVSMLMLLFAGAVGPVSAAGSPPVILEGDSLTRTISRNSTPYAFSLTLHASDLEGGALFWTMETEAGHGIAGVGSTIPGEAVVTYTPNTDYAGPDSFVVKVLDLDANFDTIQINLAVAPGIGLVTDIGGANDKGYNEMAYQGLVKAETELGITKSFYEPTSTDDFLPKLQKCADDGNKLCFAISFTMVDAVTAAANANPGTKFAIVDSYLVSPPENLRAIDFNRKEAAFLAGALAGRMSGTKIVGVVGGMDIPPVVALVEGYRNGAQCANPNMKVLIQYAGNFNDPNLGAQIAQQMMGQKADVIFSAAGPTGTGAILYSAQHGAWSIGVDTDQYLNAFGNGTIDGSAKLLSSAMNKINNAVFITVNDYMAGTFSSGNVTYNLSNDGVGLAPFHETDGVIPLATKTYLNSLRTKLINGTNKVNLTCRYSPKSSGSLDGWILESTETSGAGGSLNAGATTLFIGDNAQDKQYRSILSFNTAAIPDNATITKVQIKIRSAGIVGANPFTTHSGLRFDIRKGYFSTSANLQLPDFQATPSLSLAGAFGSTLASGWYTATLSSTALTHINKTALTQIRLRFYKDDDDDLFADYLKIYSGNAPLANQPQLIISYRQP